MTDKRLERIRGYIKSEVKLKWRTETVPYLITLIDKKDRQLEVAKTEMKRSSDHLRLSEHPDVDGTSYFLDKALAEIEEMEKE